MPITRSSQSLSIRKGGKVASSTSTGKAAATKTVKPKPIYGKGSIYKSPFTKG